ASRLRTPDELAPHDDAVAAALVPGRGREESNDEDSSLKTVDDEAPWIARDERGELRPVIDRRRELEARARIPEEAGEECGRVKERRARIAAPRLLDHRRELQEVAAEVFERPAFRSGCRRHGCPELRGGRGRCHKRTQRPDDGYLVGIERLEVDLK